MNEEEKKAIERFSKAFEYLNVWNKELIVVPEDKKYFLTVLNLLEKKDTLIHTMQSEFERLEDLEDNTDMLKMELEKKDKEIQFQKEINKTEQDRHKQTEKSLKGQLKKKDKIINELEDIFYNYQLCEYELTDCTYRKCEYIADDEIPPCKECIKQYFENKVTDTNVGERKVENGN